MGREKEKRKNNLCEFLDVCQKLYTDKLKTKCPIYTADAKCSFHKGRQSVRIKEIFKNKDTVPAKFEGKTMLPMNCPRSLHTKLYLYNPCVNQHCSFYGENLAYNCIVLHKDIFFENYNVMPRNVVKVGKGLTDAELDNFIKISVFISRLTLIMVRYQHEMGDYIGKIRHLKTVKARKMFFGKDKKVFLEICPICSAILVGGHCKCRESKKLMRRRIKQSHFWSKRLERYSKKVFRNKNPYNLQFEEVTIQLKEWGLPYYLKGWLYQLKMNNIRLKDIPFGYLFYVYHEMFESKTKDMADNFGMSIELYDKNKKLFLNNKPEGRR